jgi:hypothetical protein
MKADGSGRRQLARPDSSKLAFCHHGGDGNWAVWTVNADGSDPRQLTHPTLTLPRGSGGDSPGPWSPDGKRLSYYSGTARDLFISNADGTHARRILRWRGGDSPNAGCRAARSSSHTGRATKPGTQTGIRSAPTARGYKRCPGWVAPATHSTGSRLADPGPAADRKDIDCEPCSPVMAAGSADHRSNRAVPPVRAHQVGTSTSTPLDHPDGRRRLGRGPVAAVVEQLSPYRRGDTVVGGDTVVEERHVRRDIP